MPQGSRETSKLAAELESVARRLRGGRLTLEAVPGALLTILQQVTLSGDASSLEEIPAGKVTQDEPIPWDSQAREATEPWTSQPAESPYPPTGRATAISRPADASSRESSPSGALDLSGAGLVDLEVAESLLSPAELLGFEASGVMFEDTTRPALPPGSLPQPSAPAIGLQLDALPATRYEVRDSLGMGGQGDVREVFDRSLQRVVALKALREELADQPRARRSFLREASLTAQLTHPGVVPVYDVGELASGAPAYTMKRVRGRSLRDILQALRRGEEWAQEYNRRHLLDILTQVAHTVGYAHHRGVIHRDLKPANLMIGDYGEVLVVDWGIARLFSPSEADNAEGQVDLTNLLEPTAVGTIKGTPAYMSPEQARGEASRLGPWTDVHALGLILYEILLQEPARPPGSAEEIVQLARHAIELSPEARRLLDDLGTEPIPEELDRICMRCLAPRPEDRYPDGEVLARALRAWLDGQRQRELAECKAVEGEQKAAALQAHDQALTSLHAQLSKARERIEPWADLERKRGLWALEGAVQEAERAREDGVKDVEAIFNQALDHDPANRRARSGLSSLYYQRLLNAERLGRQREVRQLEAEIRRLDDGSFSNLLRAYGSLSLESVPDRAEVWLYRYDLNDKQLQPVEGRKLGRTPVEVDQLPMGRYLVVIRQRGGRDVHYPVLIRRSAQWEGVIRLHPEIDDRFVHIPASSFIMGGDRLASAALPREERWVGDFAIARLPVSCKEYQRFLNALPPEDAAPRIPRAPSIQGGTRWWQQEGRQVIIPRVDEAGGRWDPRYPVRAISLQDAQAYAAWRSRVDDKPYRLPTEAEWEKAGRGVDGRFFPWGDQFDATFCKMRETRPGRPDPEPCGSVAGDRSPYGVQDLAGSVSEWVLDPYDRYQLLGTLKGGNWRSGEAACRLARRQALDPEEPAPLAGFRLVMELE